MKFLLTLFAAFWRIMGSEVGALDTTSFASALKEYYTNDKVENLVYPDNAFLGLVAKMEDFQGKNLPLPIIFGNPQGRSATIGNAINNQTNSQLKEFFLTRSKDYSIATISNEVIEASKSDKGAFLEAATVEIDGAMQAIARSLAISLFRDGSGTIGQVGNSSFATTTLTLANANDVVNFEVGQTIVVSSSSGGTPRTGSLVISGVDRNAGTLTTSQNLSTGISAIAQNDYISVQGDTGLKLSGLDAWLPMPSVTVTSTAFFGVDRTSDVTRLAGVRMDLRGAPIEEQIQKLATRIAREGGRPDLVLMSFDNWLALDLALGSRVKYLDLKAGETGVVGFQAIMINGPKGPMKVVPDQNCQNDRIYVLTSSTWKLYSLGKAPKLFDTDGLKMLRDSATDALQIRCYYYAQLGCRAPGWNGVGQIA